MILTEKEAKELLSCNIEGHDEEACLALRLYDIQADRRGAKPLSFYAEMYSKTIRQLQQHWPCIERSRGNINSLK